MPHDLPLGRKTGYPVRYDPGLLRPIPRSDARQEAGVPQPLPFDGFDLWNAYELSWLDATGKPCAHVGELRFPATSPSMVESKSLKLYLCSLHEERYASTGEVGTVIHRDLRPVIGADVTVTLTPVADTAGRGLHVLPGTCIDDAGMRGIPADVDPGLLAESVDEENVIDETLHSHLFKTNCPVTGQPDWASILIRYLGPRIEPRKLLGYLVSYRRHQGFAEACVERIFMDIRRQCRPAKLTVHARFNRRGGLDINPFRSDFETKVANLRLWRQ